MDLGDPTTAYALVLLGGVLVIVECLRPGIVWAGIAGSVLITVSCAWLSQLQWTWYGIALLAVAFFLGLQGLWRRSAVPGIVSALAFGAGSACLIRPPDRIHPALLAAGVLFAVACNCLIWIAARARLGKRIA